VSPTLVAIAARCPLCGSADVIYSCNPHCCFNHVCGDCRASWQHRTTALPSAAEVSVAPADADYDTAFPAAPCAGCGGLVFRIEGTDTLYCPACRRSLRLECTDVQAYEG
jgi:hypothetical protein